MYIKKFKVDLRNFFYGDKINKCYKNLIYINLCYFKMFLI